MPSHSCRNYKSKAFSLIELSMLLVVIALGVSTVLAVSTGTVKREAREEVVDKRAAIVEALDDFLDRNGRYPCVASYSQAPETATFGREILADCTTDTSTPGSTLRIETSTGSGVYVRIGTVPVRDLLLDDDYMSDSFGNRFTYVVMEGLTKTTGYSAATAALVIKDGAGTDLSTQAAFVVFSHGADGKGAYRYASGTLKQACGASANLDVENCDADATFRATDFSESTTAALYYDDLFSYALKGVPGETVESPSPTPPPMWTGFRIDGRITNAYLGNRIATGDLNGDGFDDVAIGDWALWQNGQPVVIFGSATGIATPIDTATLDGSNGFRLVQTISGNAPTSSVAFGDINNDGIDDLILGANQNTVQVGSTGGVYVIFGKAGGWTANLDVSTLNGTDGFKLYAPVSGTFGYEVASGDVNGDGFDDIVVTAPDLNNMPYIYVLFGKTGAWATTTNVHTSLDGTNGFRLDGQTSGQWHIDQGIGISASIGNINGDAYGDLIIGCYYCTMNGADAGAVLVIFGKASGWAATSVATGYMNGTAGFRLDGAASALAGNFVSAGDINNDGFDDVITTALPSSMYVAFGKAGAWAASTTLTTIANGTTGFSLLGSNAVRSVASGDFNNDGFDDIIAGVPDDDFNGTNSGSAYIVFGKAGAWAPGADNFSTLMNGTAGFRLDGAPFVSSDDCRIGFSAGSGDVNGDGFDDILVGSWKVDIPSRTDSGASYGIYGKAGSWTTPKNIETITVP